MVRRFPIKTKAAAAMAVPLAMLFLVATLEVLQGTRQVREVRTQTDLATAAIGPSGLVTALQNERNYSVLWMIGSEGIVDLPVDSFEEARRATDDATGAFGAELERKGGDVERIYRPALGSLDELRALRTEVDEYSGPRVVSRHPVVEGVWGRYSQIVTALAERNSQLAIEVDDYELRLGVRLIDMASREVDRIGQFVRVALLAAATGDGVLRDRAEILEASPLEDEAVRWHHTIVARATGLYADQGEELARESDATNAIPLAEDIMRTGQVDITALLEAISIADDESYYGFIDDVSAVVADRADELNAAALDRLRRYAAAAVVLVLAIALAISALVSRSITRPLRSLTDQANDMARRRLPASVRSVLETPRGEDVAVPVLEPVRVDSGDEVADVAAMLNVVQTAALHLAVEQAVLRRNVADAFVSLAKRNQRLLDRQLGFITELEADETQGDTIANLFRLDHHATRMRRNAESLLVLAGAEPDRRWGVPVGMLDVVRAALGEVEDYPRVTHSAVAPATVAGTAVADLTHLLAELIENALRFSPPTERVEVWGRPDGDGYLLAVVDSGFGMGPADITQANRRLAQAEDFTVAPSKYLGHYVAGTLAARHGVAVWLEASPGGGVTAAVRLPRELVTGDEGRLPEPDLVLRSPLWPPTWPPSSPAAGTPVAPAPQSPPVGTPRVPVPRDGLYASLNDFAAGVERGRRAGRA